MKKRLAFILILLLIAANCTGIASAFAVNSVNDNYHVTYSEKDPRADELIWVVRTNSQGVREKRLWNATKARWETDWMVA